MEALKKVIDVTCPTCGAKPSRQCVNAKGRPVKAHGDRLMFAASRVLDEALSSGKTLSGADALDVWRQVKERIDAAIARFDAAAAAARRSERARRRSLGADAYEEEMRLLRESCSQKQRTSKIVDVHELRQP
jgi:uncharacterized Zn finger protein (UPF0148 family)